MARRRKSPRVQPGLNNGASLTRTADATHTSHTLHQGGGYREERSIPYGGNNTVFIEGLQRSKFVKTTHFLLFIIQGQAISIVCASFLRLDPCCSGHCL